MSENAKFLSVLMATLHDKKQALYMSFFNMLLQLPIHQKQHHCHCLAKINLWMLEAAKEVKVEVLIFFTAHAHCLKLNIID